MFLVFGACVVVVFVVVGLSKRRGIRCVSIWPMRLRWRMFGVQLMNIAWRVGIRCGQQIFSCWSDNAIGSVRRFVWMLFFVYRQFRILYTTDLGNSGYLDLKRRSMPDFVDEIVDFFFRVSSVPDFLHDRFCR